MMDYLNFAISMLAGIAALITIYGSISARSPAVRKSLFVLFIPALALFFFIPFVKNENEIINKGPIFAAINSIEDDKTGYILIDKNKSIPVINIPVEIPPMSKIAIRTLGGLWSKKNEKAYMKLVFSNDDGCNNVISLMYSNQISQNNTENYRDITKMKSQDTFTSIQCDSPINSISIFIDPGTWALTLNHIKVLLIEKISIFSFVKRNYLS